MSTDQGPRSGPAFQITPRRVIAIVLIVLSIVFIVENRAPVQLRLIFPLATLPLWVALSLTFVVGGATGWLLSHRRNSRRS